MDSEEENIKKMLKGEPYTHEGMTEYGGLPPMSPKPRTYGKRRMPADEYKALIDKFVEVRKKHKK